jgi:peptidase C25-like protein
MVRTVAQDQRGATFDIVPGDVRFDAVTVGGVAYTKVGLAGGLVLESPGRPSLPSLNLHVAIPDGMSPRLRIVSEEWAERAGASPIPVVKQRFVSDDPLKAPISEFTTEPDPAIYRGSAAYPTQAAELGAGAMVGEWWVAPIRVHPVRWDPRAGSFKVLRRMTVRVDFVAATDREMSVRPVSRPGQARAWDRVQRGLVKNYTAARAFPVKRTSGLGSMPKSSMRAPSRLAANAEWRLSVAQTGWVSVSYATLAASGFPSGIAIADVRVEERGYDDALDTPTASAIPVVARDANSNTTFDVGDVVTFYARSLRDRYGTGNIELRYASNNAYWLTWGSTPAPVPGTVSGVIGGAATIPTSFRDVIRLEENHAAMMAPTWNATSPPEAIEYLFWTDGLDGDQFQTQIPFVDPDPAQPFRIRARYQGRLGSIHRVDTFFDGASGTDTLSFNDEFSDPFPGLQPVYLLDTGFTIPGSHIGGPMRYRHVGMSRPNLSVPPSDPSRAPLDVIEATYNRLYKARSNVLRFTSGGSGGVFEIHVDGFTSTAIEIYDVTDPLSPLRIPDGTVSGTGPYAVQFRTDATSGERRFIAFVPGTETTLSGTSAVADAASNLRTPSPYDPTKEARAILITPEPFFAESDRLAGIRRNQGYVVEVAKIQDVYDEFNGGLKSPRAIRRYIRHGYLSWTPRPTYVVLAGDGSLDYRHDIESSGVDWIPTYMRFEPIQGTQGPEQVAQDPYYYSMDLATPEPGGGSLVPNVSLTRIPASSAQELSDYIDKVVAYENFGPGDTWRGRQFLFGDDAYSQGINATQPYCFSGSEIEFEDAIRDVANITTQGLGGIGIQNDFFYLKTYTDAVPAVGGCRNRQDVKTQLGQTGGGYDQFRSEMGQGSLVVNMQTHGNRYVITHEDVICNSPVFCASPNDPQSIQNVGKPFYLMVWGCHTNQFPDLGAYFRDVRIGPVDSLDALGEQFLFLPNRGSIASLGSTALEFLQTNHIYSNFVTNAFYTTPPAPPPPPGEPAQARWILGEVMLQAQIANGLSGSPASIMTRTIHLFADPMLRMDALPPRAAQVMVDSVVIVDRDPRGFTSDLPTANSTVIAELRDEVGIGSVYLTEQDLTGGPVTPVDTLSYSVVYSDSSRVATLTASMRPRVGNYDVQIRSIDINGRAGLFTLEVRTPIHYFAGAVEIVNNTFVQSDAVLRAEVTAPIPLTSDSLELRIDGAPVSTTKTQRDASGRVWTLQTAPGVLTTGNHTIQVAFNGRTAGFDQRTFQTTSEFTIRGVAVVDPRMQGVGCGGSIFQYELSASARKVELLLMTVAGRRVASIDVPGQAGLNVYCWNGRDSQSHDTAQGVYLYRIRATDSNGKTTSKDGRMIRAR